MSEYGFCECGCGGRTTIATKTDRQNGSVKGEPRRFIYNHHARLTNRPRRRLSTADYREEDRGYATPCWIWLGSARGYGYGKVGIGGRYVAAHRAYYEEFIGQIPEGLEIDHLCAVPLCVNPAHLEAVTRAVNIRRAAERRIPRDAIERIRSHVGSLVPLARELGISNTHAYDIRNGKVRV